MMDNLQNHEKNEPKSSQAKKVRFLETPASNQGDMKRARIYHKDDGLDTVENSEDISLPPNGCNEYESQMVPKGNQEVLKAHSLILGLTTASPPKCKDFRDSNKISIGELKNLDLNKSFEELPQITDEEKGSFMSRPLFSKKRLTVKSEMTKETSNMKQDHRSNTPTTIDAPLYSCIETVDEISKKKLLSDNSQKRRSRILAKTKPSGYWQKLVNVDNKIRVFWSNLDIEIKKSDPPPIPSTQILNFLKINDLKNGILRYGRECLSSDLNGALIIKESWREAILNLPQLKCLRHDVDINIEPLKRRWKKKYLNLKGHCREKGNVESEILRVWAKIDINFVKSEVPPIPSYKMFEELDETELYRDLLKSGLENISKDLNYALVLSGSFEDAAELLPFLRKHVSNNKKIKVTSKQQNQHKSTPTSKSEQEKCLQNSSRRPYRRRSTKITVGKRPICRNNSPKSLPCKVSSSNTTTTIRRNIKKQPISNADHLNKDMNGSGANNFSKMKHRWNVQGKQKLPPSTIKWTSKSIFRDTIFGRHYFSSFKFRHVAFCVGDFVTSETIIDRSRSGIYRIIGAFQALYSYRGVFEDPREPTTDIQKRGHAYILVVPLSKERIGGDDEIMLDNRKDAYIDENNVYKWPVWLGTKDLAIIKTNVVVERTKSNAEKSLKRRRVCKVSRCISETKKKGSYLVNHKELDEAQIDLLDLDASSSAYISRFVKKNWDPSLLATRVQFTSSNRKSKEKEIPCFPYVSSDESDTEDYMILREARCRPRLVVEIFKSTEQALYETPSSVDDTNATLEYFDQQNSDGINRIFCPSNIETMPFSLHKNLIKGTLKLKNVSHIHRYLLYDSSLGKSMICMNSINNESLKCVLISSCVDPGVIVIVEENNDVMYDHTKRMKSSRRDGLQPSIFSLGDNDENGLFLARISFDIMMKKIEGPIYIFATDVMLSHGNVIETIIKMRPQRIVYNEIAVSKVAKIHEKFGVTSYTYITNFLSLEGMRELTSKCKRRFLHEKTTIISMHKRNISFHVEHKSDDNQVPKLAKRINKIIYSFQSTAKLAMNENIPVKNIPLCLCYCLDDEHSKAIKQILDDDYHIVTEVVPSTSAVIDNDKLRRFREGSTKVLCLTKAYSELQTVLDIRFAFHTSPALSLQDYVNETQCVGCDGRPSFCIMFFNIIEKRALHAKLHKKSVCNEFDKEMRDKMLEEVLKYGMSADTSRCRHEMLGLKVMNVDSKDEDGNSKESKYCCDNCQLRAGLPGCIFPRDNQSNGSCKDVDISWIVEDMLKEMKKRSKYKFKALELRDLIVEERIKKVYDGRKCSSGDVNELVEAIRTGSMCNHLASYMEHFGILESKKLEVKNELIEKTIAALKEERMYFKIRGTSSTSVNMNQSHETTVQEYGSFFEARNNSQPSMQIVLPSLFECIHYSDFTLEKKVSTSGLYNTELTNSTKSFSLIISSQIPLQWFGFIPFYIYFEICRIHSTQSNQAFQFESFIYEKMLDPFWDWSDHIKVSALLRNLSPAIFPNLHLTPISDKSCYLSARICINGVLELLPPSYCEPNNHIFRHFGSHRFLYVYVYSKQRRHLEHMILGRSGEPYMNICNRMYRWLWVDKYSYPQTIVYFAEEGTGIDKDEEMKVGAVRDWCIPQSWRKYLTVDEEYASLSHHFKSLLYVGEICRDCIEIVDDIVDRSGENVLTAGAGLVSWKMIDHIWRNYRKTLYGNNVNVQKSNHHNMTNEAGNHGVDVDECPHTAFQGRLGGIYGIWALDESLGDCMKIICRKSQIKYDAEDESRVHVDLHLYRWCGDGLSEPGYVSARMIQLLEHRGAGASMLLKHVKKIRKTAKEKIPQSMTECGGMKIKSCVELMIPESKYVWVIPDHTQLLDEGEAFVTGHAQRKLRSLKVSSVVVMKKEVYFEDDLIKLTLPCRTHLRKRSVLSCGLSAEKKECTHSKYDLNRTDPYGYFEEMREGYLIVSTKGKNSAAATLLGNNVGKEEAWVCWNDEIVEAVTDEGMKNEKSNRMSVEENNMKKCSKPKQVLTTKDIFNNIWGHRYYDRKLKLMNLMMDAAVDMFGFSSDESKILGRLLYKQEHCMDFDESSEVLEKMEKALMYKGYPHWIAQIMVDKVKFFESRKAMGCLWNAFILSKDNASFDV